jgi:hypothetical protein
MEYIGRLTDTQILELLNNVCSCASRTASNCVVILNDEIEDKRAVSYLQIRTVCLWGRGGRWKGSIIASLEAKNRI